MNRHTPDEIDFILAHPASYSLETLREAERQKAAQDQEAKVLGIKEARPKLGDLVREAAEGGKIHITIGGAHMAILVQDPKTVAYGGSQDD